MNPVEIIYGLRKLNRTQRALADELGVSHSTVNNTIHGRTTSFVVADAIAKLLNADVETVFPGQYEFKPRRRAKRVTSGGSPPQG